jgi:soluble lytic murein transglycosylase-like protein
MKDAMPIPTKFIDVVILAASTANVNLKLLCAIIETESSWNRWAIHLDEGFKGTINVSFWAQKNGAAEATETQAQSTSWGLAQIEGATARRLGFTSWLPQLCDPIVNLKYATMLLSELDKRYGVLTDQISAYNAGHPLHTGIGYVNQGYVTKVLKAMDNY